MPTAQDSVITTIRVRDEIDRYVASVSINRTDDLCDTAHTISDRSRRDYPRIDPAIRLGLIVSTTLHLRTGETVTVTKPSVREMILGAVAHKNHPRHRVISLASTEIKHADLSRIHTVESWDYDLNCNIVVRRRGTYRRQFGTLFSPVVGADPGSPAETLEFEWLDWVRFFGRISAT
ncbi:hypothetical protein HJC99_06415 [Candidatus Saccharibacteria bacterium]|nr:hypothetical protein [Candidatus Saccharibacteria bacterium]